MGPGQISFIFTFLASLTVAIPSWSAKIRIGSSPVMSSAGIYIALEKDYFKEMGLDIEVTDFQSSGAAMTLLLAKGEMEVGAGNLSSGLFNAMAEGHKFKLVADKGHIEKNADYIQLVVRADHIKSGRYKELKDLKGFTMGLTALDGVSQQIVAERFLKKAGLAEKDVTFIKMSYAEMDTAFKSKNLDATITLEPFVTQGELGGYTKKIAGASSVHPKQQSAAIFFAPHFIEKNREQAVKFVAAYIKGIRLYNQAAKEKNTSEEVKNILKKYMKIDDANWPKLIPVGLNEDGCLNITALEEDVQWYIDKGYIKKPLSMKDVADTSLCKEAVKLL